MDIKLATNATIMARCSDMARFPRPNLVTTLLFYQSSHGTDLDALATEYAFRTRQNVIAHGYDLGLFPTKTIVDGIVYLDNIACINTPATQNAPREITYDEGTGHLGGVLGIFSNESAGVHLIAIGIGLEFTGAMGGTQLFTLIRSLHIQLEFRPVPRILISNGTIVIARL